MWPTEEKYQERTKKVRKSQENSHGFQSWNKIN